ncbi:hypothetical protein [Methylobrevis pamukkalensis]|uniref:Uncharacterized protein n=1 Tax=Methylobrevis pamukkalensis TaxID=1439726 RepID=A0A1E3H5Q7_9HYPH|nr:hypothetical protein [Methylobrevis pamukkalensis]ODN71485.1 hypothetical protein A6302_01174 [Methylobrevis pamukkalensis]
MSFGKRGVVVAPKPRVVIEQPKEMDPEEPRDHTGGVSLTSRLLLVFIVLLVASTGLTYYLFIQLGHQLARSWESVGEVPNAEKFHTVVGFGGGQLEETEASIHRKCLASATSDLASIIRMHDGDASRVAWMYGPVGVRRVASYVDCSMTRPATDLCHPEVKGRIVDLVVSYLEVQKSEWRKEQEEQMMRDNSIFGFRDKEFDETVAKITEGSDYFDQKPRADDPAFLAPDPRIRRRLVSLAEKGILQEGDFAPGFFSKAPKFIAEIFATTKVTGAGCD